MILVRDIFRVKFGKAKQATDLWKQGVAILRRSDFTGEDIRLLTDLAGAPYYTIVLESKHESLAAWEKSHEAVGPSPEWRSLYEQVIALTETGHREIFKIVE